MSKDHSVLINNILGILVRRMGGSVHFGIEEIEEFQADGPYDCHVDVDQNGVTIAFTVDGEE